MKRRHKVRITEFHIMRCVMIYPFEASFSHNVRLEDSSTIAYPVGRPDRYKYSSSHNM